MSVFDWLLSTVRPPGINFQRRRSLFRSLALAVQVVADDAKRVLKEWFPLTCSLSGLAVYGEVLGIPRMRGDTEEDYRLRLATASLYLEKKGRRSFVLEYLERVVPGRYKIIEFPKDGFRVGFSAAGGAPVGTGGSCHVFIRNMTALEKERLYEFLDAQLDPDIEINISEWRTDK